MNQVMIGCLTATDMRRLRQMGCEELQPVQICEIYVNHIEHLSYGNNYIAVHIYQTEMT